MFIIFDLDGTLADITHRVHYVDKALCKKEGRRPDYDAFHHACVYDRPILETITLYKTLKNAGHYIQIWSGRSDSVRSHTEAWLREHGLTHYGLMMRTHGDYTPDYKLKQQWLHAIDPTDRPAMVFDDRKKVVDMWRANGIRCMQVAPGEF